MEWWYYSGQLEAEDGSSYGFELTFFKALPPPRSRLLGFLPVAYLVGVGQVAHAALTYKNGREGGGRFTQAQRADFWGYRAGASEDDLMVFVGDWRVSRGPDGSSHELVFSLPGAHLELTLSPEKATVLHGSPPGILVMGEAGASYYLSATRMGVSGSLQRDCTLLACRELSVTGQAWHDHQWGNFDLTSIAGWDWFALQLDDDREIMLYLIRNPDGSLASASGSLVDRRGGVHVLKAGDFLVSTTGEWKSPMTAAVYPMGWRLEVPAYHLELEVKPALLNQEMTTRATTGITYWEGAVVVTGSLGGLGYVELTNYDRYPYRRVETGP